MSFQTKEEKDLKLESKATLELNLMILQGNIKLNQLIIKNIMIKEYSNFNLETHRTMRIT